MQVESILKSYARFAPIYDRTFGAITTHGRLTAISMANSRPASILEVGVGTGINLPYYRSDHQVHGIDISPEMLKKAHQRVEKRGLRHVASLQLMDARAMEFQDHSFDVVIATHVMSVVPEPHKVIKEMERVCKPGGDVIILNHFVAKRGVRRTFETMLSPFSPKLGYRPDMGIDEILNYTSLTEVTRYTLPPFNLFTLLHMKAGKTVHRIQ